MFDTEHSFKGPLCWNCLGYLHGSPALCERPRGRRYNDSFWYRMEHLHPTWFLV